MEMVSVLMTAYNREQYIAEAIESVLVSTYTNFELIIVDDGSTDNTVNIAMHYMQRDIRVKLYVNKKNLGQFPNRNTAASYAKGEYIFWVDSDDTIYPESITKLVSSMKVFPEAGYGMFAPAYDKVSLMQGRSAIYDHFFKAPFLSVGPGGTILRRLFFERIGRYPCDYGIPGDMFFNLKVCCYSSIVLIPFNFMNYRRHEGQEINNSYDYLYNNYKYLRDALEKLPLGLEYWQIEWLKKKNKRRFTVNIVRFFFSTFNFKKTSIAIRNADFTFRDALQGVFH